MKQYMLLTQTAPIIKVHIYDAQKFGSVCVLDCKTARTFAYSSTREQSNERSGTRLKTESETGERRFSLARFALKTLKPRFTDFFTDFEKKNRLFCSLFVSLII